MKKSFIFIFLLIQIYSLNLKEKNNPKKHLNEAIKPNLQNETEKQGDGFLESVGFDDSDFLDLFENIIKLPFKLIKDFNEEVSNENKSVFDMFHHNGNEQKINELQKDLKEIKQNLK